MVVNGHYNGERVILDEPRPRTFPVSTPMKVVFRPRGEKTRLQKLADWARPGEPPTDFAVRHEYYVKGTPRG